MESSASIECACDLHPISGTAYTAQVTYSCRVYADLRPVKNAHGQVLTTLAAHVAPEPQEALLPCLCAMLIRPGIVQDQNVQPAHDRHALQAYSTLTENVALSC